MAEYITEATFSKFLEEETKHHKEADDRVRAVEVQVAAVGQQVAAVGMQLTAQQPQIALHHKTLFGNGQPGMDELLRQLVAWMNEQKEEKKTCAATAATAAAETRKWWQSEVAKYVYFLVTVVAVETIMHALGIK